MRLNRAALKLLLTSNTVLLQNQKHKKNRDGDKTVHLQILGGISLKKYIYTWRTKMVRTDRKTSLQKGFCKAQESSQLS